MPNYGRSMHSYDDMKKQVDSLTVDQDAGNDPNTRTNKTTDNDCINNKPSEDFREFFLSDCTDLNL